MEGVEIASKLFSTKSFKKYDFKLIDNHLPACKMFGFGERNYWKCVMMEYTNTFHHLVDTCKMSPKSDPEGVNKRLKVYGIDSLRVVHASIMPKIVRGSTKSAIMIEEKASDMIKGALKTGHLNISFVFGVRRK